MDYKIDSAYDCEHQNFAKFDVPRTVYDTLMRNLRQAQYPNSKVNEPINNFNLFLPKQNINSQAGMRFVTQYGKGENKVLDYNAPMMQRYGADGNKQICSKPETFSMSYKNMKIYRDTKPQNKFPVPLATDGTNNLKVLIDPKKYDSTFTYTRYGPPVNNYYVDCPIYYGEISQETIMEQENYIDKIELRNNDLYNGIIEDMNILSGLNDNSKQNTVAKSRTIQSLQRS
jgi:hypothetical protein